MSFVIPTIGTAVAPSVGCTCTDTVSELIADTQRHLYGTSGVILNILDGTITDSAQSVVLTYDLDGLGPRRVIAMDDELMYVLTKDDPTKTLTVLRGHQGTTPAVHSDGAIIEVAPRFPRPFIRAALAEEIKSWPESLYSVATYDLSTSTAARGYDLPIGNYVRIIDAYLSPDAPTTTEAWTRIPFIDRRNVPTADFPSGNSVTFETTFAPSRTVRIVYARGFDASDVSDAVDVCATIGVPCSAMDIPPLGAAWRLIQGKEVRRMDLNAQGQNRAAEQVQGGIASNTTRAFKQLRDERIQQEVRRLMALYPIRFKVR